MSYLIRFYQEKPHSVAHYVHRVNGIEGALCSQIPEPAVGTQSQQGEWVSLESLPPKVRICQICQKVKHKLDNPLPERVEQELAMLARWDPKAAALQREKMEAHYRQQQLKKSGR